MNSAQKKFIQKNIRNKNLNQLAADLKIDKNEILLYLKKNWRDEKYKKYLKTQLNQPQDIRQTLTAKINLDQNIGVVDFDNSNVEDKFFNIHQKISTFLASNFNVFVVLFFIVLVLYVWTLPFEFLSDDIATIKENAQIKNFDFIFATGIAYTVSRVFHFLIANIVGIEPWGFRLINIIFHLSSSFLIFLIVSKINQFFDKSKIIAFVTATLFAVHPILIEAVTWISGISSSQFTFFALLSFYFYLKPLKDNRLNYGLSLFFIFCTLSSGNRAVSAFLIFPLYQLVLQSCSKVCSSNLLICFFKHKFKYWMPYIIVGAVFGLVAILAITTRIEVVEDADMSINNLQGKVAVPLMKIPTAIVLYLWLIIFPKDLSFYQTELSFTPNQFYLIGSVAFGLFTAVMYLVYRFFRFKNIGMSKSNVLLFWVGYFIVGLIPVITPFRISWLVAERYVYFSSIGIFVIIATGFYFLYKKVDKRVVIFIYLLVIFALGMRTVFRNLDWRNQDTLWIATVKTSPSGYVIHNNMGDYYYRRGDYLKAMDSFGRALQIKPDYAEVFHNLANTQIVYAKSIAKTDPKKAEEYLNLGLNNYLMALNYNDNLYQTNIALADLYFEIGDYTKSSEQLQLVLKKAPQMESTAKYSLAQVYAKAGKLKESLQIIDELLISDPQNQELIKYKLQVQGLLPKIGE